MQRRIGGVFLTLCLTAQAVWGQKNSAPEFPQDPAQWINGRPITLESLKGKAAVLYFFEEGCPNCKKRWPELLEAAKKFTGKPVLFIGVNSGSSRGMIEQYVREVQCTWPVIVDPSRAYEKACGVHEISLQNIFSAKIITADGKLIGGNAGSMEASGETALKGAAWKVDPTGMSPALQPAWLAVEWGHYAYAGPLVKKFLASKNDEQKQGAEKIKTAVDSLIAARIAEAKKDEDAGNSFGAYKILVTLPQAFGGFDVPADVNDSVKRLATEPKVKANQAAARELDTARRALVNPTPTNVKRAIVILEKLIKDSAETDAAEDAKTLLGQLKLAFF